MGILIASSLQMMLITRQNPTSFIEPHTSTSILGCKTRWRFKKTQISAPVARLFQPAIFEASKLQVHFLGEGEKKHPGKFPRTYTLTHSDLTSKITLSISHTINISQLEGWYNKVYRDEVVAEWRKVKEKMHLHVHCHISGSNFLLNCFPKLRYSIFCNELPMVLKAFVHGDSYLLNSYPELQEALVLVYFHSNIPEFNKVECWGPLAAASLSSSKGAQKDKNGNQEMINGDHTLPPQPCQEACSCCFPLMSLIPWPQNFFPQSDEEQTNNNRGLQQQQI